MSNTTFGSELSFKVTPETLKAVNMVTICYKVVSAMFNQAMNIALGSDSGISTPGVGEYSRAFFDLLDNSRLYLFCINAVDQIGPDTAIAAEDTTDSLFGGTPTAFCFGQIPFNRKSFVFPLATEVGFVNLNGAIKDLGDIPGHGNS